MSRAGRKPVARARPPGPWNGPLGIADLRAYLSGAWHLARQVRDRCRDEVGLLEGTAVFAPEGAGLTYREAGVLRLGTYRGPFERTYRYVFPAPHRAEVRFADGRPFHDLDLARGSWPVLHLCGADRYDGAFLVDSEDSWRVAWRVTGPRRDQVLVSRYRREAQAAAFSLCTPRPVPY